MKQLNWLERVVEWGLNLFVGLLPDSIKRKVLYELVDRVEMKKPEESRDFWSVTCKEIYSTLRD